MAIALNSPPSSANVDAIKALANGGRGATVQHPRARTRAGRRALMRGLTNAGLEHRVALTLRWVTSTPPPAVDLVAPTEPEEPPHRQKSKSKRRRSGESATD
jgi:hypothetical protein